MGSPEEGQRFADQHTALFKGVPLFIDENRELYQDLDLRRPDSLGSLYASTVDVQTFTSAMNAVKSGFLPSYGAGGDLLQLGGTIIFMDGEITFVHLDESTGGHAPLELLLEHTE